MHDLNGWTPVACEQSDLIRDSLRPVSSLTDLTGQYGPPIVYTEWATDDERPVLRDYRWPNSEWECKHYVPTPTTEGDLS